MRVPPNAASRWASATETAASHTGLHAPFGSTGGALGCSRSSSQLSTRRAGASTSRRRTACGSSHTACQYEQSSMRVATACPHCAHARLGPSLPSRPQQRPSHRSGIRTVPRTSPSATATARGRSVRQGVDRRVHTAGFCFLCTDLLPPPPRRPQRVLGPPRTSQAPEAREAVHDRTSDGRGRGARPATPGRSARHHSPHT